MQIRANNKSARSSNEHGSTPIRRAVRRLARQDASLFTLPLTLALLGEAVARPREIEATDARGTDRAGGIADAPVIQPGDRLALFAGGTALVEHLLTEADIAAGQVRIALQGFRAAPADRGDDTVQPQEQDATAAADDSVQGEPAQAMAAAGGSDAAADAASAAAAGSQASDGQGGFAVTQQDDDDDRGLMWLVLGIGTGGLALAATDHSGHHAAQPAGLSGSVIKGYVQGAAVYLDIDHDGQPDGDPVYTDAHGRFVFADAPAGASLLVYGGVDTLTNVALDGVVMRAPAGATVVTPLTTLIDEMMRLDPTLDAAHAQAKLATALGLTLPNGVDLLHYDSVAAIGSGGAPVEDAAESVLNTITSIQSILVGAKAGGALDSANAAITALAQVATQGGSLHLANATDVQHVLQAAFATPGVGASSNGDLVQLSSAIASVNGTLASASGLGEQALQATRYALSGFQDVLAKVGANAQSSDQFTHDISFSSNQQIVASLNAINSSIGDVIGENAATTISYAERLEGSRFVFALNPELRLYQGAPDTVDTVKVKFSVEVLVERETRAQDGHMVVETLPVDGNGFYTLQFSELDKIFITPPSQFNGSLVANVSVHYVGLNVTAQAGALGIDILAVNDAPTAQAHSASGTEDHSYVFGVADFPMRDLTDAPYAGGANALAAIRITSLPASGTLYLADTALQAGDLVAGVIVSAADLAAGKLVYVPAANHSGAIEFTFRVQDDGGTAHGGVDWSQDATLTLDIASVNDAPVIVTAGTAHIDEDGRHTFSAADFPFSDIESNPLAGVIITSVPEGGTLYVGEHALTSGDVASGWRVSRADLDGGKLSFVPDQDNNGPITFGYRAQDGGGTANGGVDTSAAATFTVDVTAVNDAPAIETAGSAGINEDSSHVFSSEDFPFADVEDDSLAAVIITSLPQAGTLYFDGHALTTEDVAAGYSVSAADLTLGKLSFVPEADQNGSISFGYRVQDDGGTAHHGADTSAQATFTLDIASVNDAPVIETAGSAEIDEDTSHVFSSEDFPFADVEDDGLAAVIITSLPETGALYFDGHALTTEDVAEGYSVSAEDLALGKLSFVPETDQNGSISFGYRVQDTGGTANDGMDTSQEATFTLDIASVNDAPVIETAGSAEIDEDTSHVFSSEDFPFADVEENALAAVIITSLPEAGALYFDGNALTTEDVAEGYRVSAEDLALGKLSFVPEADQNGSICFGYRVQDDGGTANDGVDTSAEATFRLDITPISDAPVATGSSVYMLEDGCHVFDACDFGYTDVDGDDLAAVIIRSLPDNGTLYFDGTALTPDDIGEGWRVTAGDLADGLLKFEPNADFNGCIGFSYRVQDTGSEGLDTSEDATLSLEVCAVNDAPTLSMPHYSCEVSPQPVCDPFQVNTWTAGNQESPKIAALSDGGYVITWISQNQDGSGYGVYAQRFDAWGEKLGEEIQVNQCTAGDQFDPAVVAIPGMGFAVVWAGVPPESEYGADIYGRLFDGEGNSTPEFSLNTTQYGDQFSPSVALSQNGLMLTWTSDMQDGSGYGIYGAMLTYEGFQQEFRVNTTTNFDQFDSHVTALPDGGFAVTWTGNDDTDSEGVFLQVFNVDGSPRGPESRINCETEGDQAEPAITTLSDGSFVVTYTGPDESGSGVYVRHYDACGWPLNDAVRVNCMMENDQSQPDVTALLTGGFVVTWTSWGSVDSTLDVYAQRFGTDGEQLGDAVLVNSYTTYEQKEPAIAVLRDGSVVVTWQSFGEDGSGYGIEAQRFAPFAPDYIEGHEAVLVAPTAMLSDIELGALNEGMGDWTGASLQVKRAGCEGSEEDLFGFQNGNGYYMECGEIFHNERLVARFESDCGRLSICFVGSECEPGPTTAEVNDILRQITYANGSDNPPECVPLAYRVSDGNDYWGGEQGLGGPGRDWSVVEVRITPVNDAPEATGSEICVNEDGCYNLSYCDFGYSDAENDSMQSVTITSLPEHGTLYLCDTEVTVGQVLCPWELSELRYEPAANYNGHDSIGYQVTDTGGTAHGGSDTGCAGSICINVEPVNDLPELTMVSRDGIGNLTYQGAQFDDSCPVDGLDSARNVAVSPDGRNVYVTGHGDNSLAVFTRDESSGELSFVGKFTTCVDGVEGLDGASDVTLSPDGTTVYVTGETDGTIAWFTRDAITGNLTYGGYLQDGVDEVGGLGGACSVVVSADGAYVYAAAPGNGAIAILARDAQTGALTFVANVTDGVDGIDGLNGARDIVLSPDGLYAYVAGAGDNAVAMFMRNPETGSLQYFGQMVDGTDGVDGLAGATSIAVSADGRSLYVAGCADDAIAVFSRNPDNGQLTYVTALRDGENGIDGLDGVHSVVVSADGLSVYAAGTRDDSVAVFTRDPDTGALAFSTVFTDGNADVDGLEGAYGLALSPDGHSVYVASKCDDAVATFSRETHDPSTFVEDGCAVLITPWATLTDVDLDGRGGEGNWAGGSMMVQRAGCANSDDDFGFRDGNDLSFCEGRIYKCEGDQRLAIATFEECDGQLRISFVQGDEYGCVVPTSADVNHILQQLTYTNTSQDPPECVTLQYSVSDGNTCWNDWQGQGGEGRDCGTVEVRIVPVNDAPDVQDSTVSLNEDQCHTLSFQDFNFSDAEGDCITTLVIRSVPEHGTLYFDGEPLDSCDVECGYEVTAEALRCGRLTFTPDENYHGSASFEYQLVDDGGTAHGGSDTSDCATLTFSMRSINDAPVLELPANSYTYTVTTLLDTVDANDGVLSLREAVALAQDGESINFDASLYTGDMANVMLTSQLLIERQIYINGASEEGQSYVVLTPSIMSVEGSLVRVTDGVGSDHGGAILQNMGIGGPVMPTVTVEGQAVGLTNEGYLTLANVGIGTIFAVGSEGGGTAIAAIANSGTLHASGLDVGMVYAVGGVGTEGVDGGSAYIIFNSGTFDAADVTMELATAYGGDGFMGSGGSGGDAYLFMNAGTLFGDVTFGDDLTATGGLAGIEGEPGNSGNMGGAESSGPSEFVFTPPDISTDVVATAEYSAQGEPVLLAPNATLADAELDVLNGGDGNWSGATLTLQRHCGADKDDVFGHYTEPTFLPPALAWQDNGTITKNGYVIATWSNAEGQLVIHFTGYGTNIPTTADVNTLLQQITYSNSSYDPEHEVVIEYRVSDGNASFHGTQGSGGEGLTCGTVTVHVEPLDLGVPQVELATSTDSNESGDGITSSTAPVLHVTLPELAYAGSVIELYARGEEVPFATHTLTADDIATGWVDIDAGTVEDGDYAVTARLAGEEGNSASDMSTPYYVVVDSVAPEAPVLDFESRTLRQDNAASFAITGSAEPGATVTVSLSDGNGGQASSWTAMADGAGRFQVQVDAAGLELATVAISAVATDRAGNQSQADTATLTVTPVTDDNRAAEMHGGHGNDFIKAYGAAVVFVPGSAAGSDHFTGSEAGFDTVQINGNAGQYTITLVEGDERAAQGTALATQSQSLLENEPLYLVKQWDGGTDEFWIQADAIQFNDGFVRITPDGLVGDGAMGENRVIHGGEGNDHVSAGAGDDLLFGGLGGNDVLVGGDGDDTLVSEGGKDSLYGGAGNDTIVVFGDGDAAGDDHKVHAYGGEGEDVFVISPQTGFDRDVTVHDFVIGQDRIDLSGLRIDAGSGNFRAVTIDDLHLATLSAELQETGSANIDLSGFVDADGHQALGGTLTLTLAGGSSTLTAAEFVVDPAYATLADDELYRLAQLQQVV